MLKFAQAGYPLVFNLAKNDPEKSHGQLINTLAWLEKNPQNPVAKLLRQQIHDSFTQDHEALAQTLWDLQFPNPLGLAPGFDKEGVAAGILADFGFGFAELGAVTLHAQPGNPRPRLFRLPQDQAALNRMGANSLGAATMAQTLEKIWQRQPRRHPIGINLCKSKVTPLGEAAQDYRGSFRYLRDWADYFVVNVSSPNTPGLRSLQAGTQLKPIFDALQEENQGGHPLLIKIAPDLTWEEIKEIIDLAQEYKLAGIVATNTTIRRDGLTTKILEQTGKAIADEAGGISGAPVRERSTEVIRFIYQETQGKIPIIGVGGIFDCGHAWEKITAGASLLQVYTGWIYEGPWLVPNVLQGLQEKLKETGLQHISQAIGLDHQ